MIDNINIDYNNKQTIKFPSTFEKSKSDWRWVILMLTCFSAAGMYMSLDIPAILGTEFQNQFNINHI